jgi:hypothetical protein
MIQDKKRKSGIDKTIKKLDAYNKKHGTRLTYGKYKALERLGKLEK